MTLPDKKYFEAREALSYLKGVMREDVRAVYWYFSTVEEALDFNFKENEYKLIKQIEILEDEKVENLNELAKLRNKICLLEIKQKSGNPKKKGWFRR